MTREEALAILDTIPTISEQVDALEMAIEALQERKTGKWKPFDLTWGRCVYSCTACDVLMDVPTEMSKPIYRFCPNCGAKMEVDE